MVDEQQLAVVERHVEQASATGAEPLTGGKRLDGPGSFYPPTVLVGCSEEMAVMSEETFGPVAAVAVVADFAEGLRRAASGAYGLAATVLTPRLDHALEAAEELDVGTVKVNAVFGGAPGGSADPRRDSGSGPGFGPDLLGQLTVLKAVHLQSAPSATW
jgi:succinate-semialdehyde dehydrogenase/glutarate-semialdehyde dehydrogenase